MAVGSTRAFRSKEERALIHSYARYETIVCCWWKTKCARCRVAVEDARISVLNAVACTMSRQMQFYVSIFDRIEPLLLQEHGDTRTSSQFHLKLYSGHDAPHTGTYTMFSQAKRAMLHAWRTFIQSQTKMIIIIVCFDTEVARRTQTKWKISNDNDQHQMDLMPSIVRNKIKRDMRPVRALLACPVDDSFSRVEMNFRCQIILLTGLRRPRMTPMAF